MSFQWLVFVNRLITVSILSQIVKIKMEVQVSNPHELWLYLNDANSIIKQWEEVEKKMNCKCENWDKRKEER